MCGVTYARRVMQYSIYSRDLAVLSVACTDMLSVTNMLSVTKVVLAYVSVLLLGVLSRRVLVNHRPTVDHARYWLTSTLNVFRGRPVLLSSRKGWWGLRSSEVVRLKVVRLSWSLASCRPVGCNVCHVVEGWEWCGYVGSPWRNCWKLGGIYFEMLKNGLRVLKVVVIRCLRELLLVEVDVTLGVRRPLSSSKATFCFTRLLLHFCYRLFFLLLITKWFVVSKWFLYVPIDIPHFFLSWWCDYCIRERVERSQFTYCSFY